MPAQLGDPFERIGRQRPRILQHAQLLLHRVHRERRLRGDRARDVECRVVDLAGVCQPVHEPVMRGAFRIERLRAEARERKGWIMDTYLLRRNPGDR